MKTDVQKVTGMLFTDQVVLQVGKESHMTVAAAVNAPSG